jgi:hypothetical protein
MPPSTARRRPPEPLHVVEPRDARRDRAPTQGPIGRDNPSLWDAQRFDPALTVPAHSREEQIRDQQRWTRRLLEPVAHRLSMATITTTYVVKWLVPFPLGSQAALSRMAPEMMRRLVSPEALAFVLRHLWLETNLISFVIRNSGADDIPEPTLRPVRAADLGDDNGLNAIVRHDANLFNLIIDIGRSPTADVVTTRPVDELDFSMLQEPELDLEPHVRRLLPLDLHTAVHVLVAGLAVFMDAETGERAVNSFQYDASLFEYLANLTGDEMFRFWTPEKFSNWLGVSDNVGRDLHWHMIVTEYAHERLCRLGDGRATPDD